MTMITNNTKLAHCWILQVSA